MKGGCEQFLSYNWLFILRKYFFVVQEKFLKKCTIFYTYLIRQLLTYSCTVWFRVLLTLQKLTRFYKISFDIYPEVVQFMQDKQLNNDTGTSNLSTSIKQLFLNFNNELLKYQKKWYNHSLM